MKEWQKYLIIIALTSVFSFYMTGIFNPFVRYETGVTVPASPDDTWTAYTDTAGMRLWLDGLVALQMTNGDSLKAGTTYDLILEQDGDRYALTQTITALQRPAYIEYRIENDILTNDMRVEFLPVDSATSVRVTNKVAGKSFFWRAVFTIFKGSLIDHQQADYVQFQSWIESGA